MFEKTITIEHQKDRIFKFTENMNKFHNKFVFNDLKSRFIYGLSHETSCVEKIDKVLNGEKYEELRQAHREERFDDIPYCKDCDQLYQSPDVLIWSNDKSAGINHLLGTDNNFILTDYNFNKRVF